MNPYLIALIVISSLLTLAVLSFFVATFVLFKITVSRRALIGKKVFKKFNSELSSYGIDRKFWQEHKVEKLSLKVDNLTLKGFYVKNDSEKIAIILHGYFSSHLDMTIQAKLFYKNGFNVFCPDLRAHGESEGKATGMGYFESEDLISWVKLLNKKFNSPQIVIFGWSMGGATACLASFALPKNVKCIISDCAYTSAYEQFKFIAKSRHICEFPLLNLANIGVKMFAGYSLKDVDVIKSVKKCNLPILFIHGKADSFVPCFMTEKLYENKIGPKKLELFENAEHCKSYISDKDRYEKIILEFINLYIY